MPATVTDLEERFLGEQFTQDTAAAPDVDGGAVPFLPQEELRRSVPQGDHFVGVGSLLVLSVVQPVITLSTRVSPSTTDGIYLARPKSASLT